MGQKNTKGTVIINDTDGRIRLRWRYRTIRYSINLNAYNKVNLLKAKRAALQIEQDRANDKFDYSLNGYKGESENFSSVNKSIVQYFEEWTSDIKQMDCEIPAGTENEAVKLIMNFPGGKQIRCNLFSPGQ